MHHSIKSFFYSICLLVTLFYLGGCVFFYPHYRVIGNVTTLSELRKLHAIYERTTDLNKETINAEGLREMGLHTSIQAGLAFRANQINQMRVGSEKALDKQFNFNALLLPNNVLPPVVVQAERSVNLADAQSLRIVDRTYQIISPAKFVTAAPTWRDYLPMHYDFPEVPPATFLPKNQKEQVIWDAAVKEGWRLGINQAEAIDKENCARLVRDFLGMQLYRKLLKQGIISPPEVAHSSLGITGDDQMLRVHDQIMRMTRLPKLKKNTAHQWKPIIVEHDTA